MDSLSYHYVHSRHGGCSFLGCSDSGVGDVADDPVFINYYWLPRPKNVMNSRDDSISNLTSSLKFTNPTI